jgi:hypothetical protein
MEALSLDRVRVVVIDGSQLFPMPMMHMHGIAAKHGL